MTRGALALVALALGCGGTAAEPDAPATTGPIERHVSVAPGRFAEVDLDVPSGSRVVTQFTASTVVAWNVHSHPGGQVVIHQQGEQTTGTIEIAPDVGGAYSVLWENHSTGVVEIDLRVELSGGANVIGWHPR